MGRPAKNAPVWVSTAVACKELGISRYTLHRLQGTLLKPNWDWRIANPQARRLTYRWHLERCRQRLDNYTPDS